MHRVTEKLHAVTAAVGHKLSSLVDNGHENNHGDEEDGGHVNNRNERSEKHSQHQKDGNRSKESGAVGMNDMHVTNPRERVMGYNDGRAGGYHNDYNHISHSHNDGSLHCRSSDGGGGVDEGSNDISYQVSQRLHSVADQLSSISRMQRSSVCLENNSSGVIGVGVTSNRDIMSNDDHTNLLLKNSIKKIRELADILVYKACIDDYDVMAKEDDRVLKAL